jgi:hypothetical protein
MLVRCLYVLRCINFELTIWNRIQNFISLQLGKLVFSKEDRTIMTANARAFMFCVLGCQYL